MHEPSHQSSTSDEELQKSEWSREEENLQLFSPCKYVCKSFLVAFHDATRLHNKTPDVFSPEYKANTSRRIRFSADLIANTSSNVRLYTAFAMHLAGICPNITQFTVLAYWLTYLIQIFDVFL